MGNVALVITWLLCIHRVPVYTSITIARDGKVFVRSELYVVRPLDLRARKRLMEARRAELDIPEGRDRGIAAGVMGIVTSYWLIVRQFPGSEDARLARWRIEALGYREVGPGRWRLNLPPDDRTRRGRP
jgi:hypothetical protein